MNSLDPYYKDSGLKWVRSNNGVFFGVCRGLGDSFGLSSALLRLLWLISILFFGTGLFLYFVFAVSLPREDQVFRADEPRFLGVSSRVAKRLNLEVGLVRLLTVLLALFSFGATIVGYIVLHIVLDQQEVTR